MNRVRYKNDSYERYKHLEVSITGKELKEIWFRDKAWLLKKPSIDRIDTSKGYTKDNCRYIELSENSRQGGIKGSASRWG